MAIKSLLQGTEPATSEFPYPYLGLAKNNRVVLFTAPGKGVMLRKSDREERGQEKSVSRIGVSDHDWHEPSFARMQGELLLRNE